jgi:hypothetical protein
MRRQDSRSIQLSATGAGETTFGPVPADAVWDVERLGFETSAVATVEVRVGDYLMDRSSGVAASIADENRPIHVPARESLRIIVTGGPANGLFFVDAQYDVHEPEPAKGGSRGPKAPAISGLRPRWW